MSEKTYYFCDQCKKRSEKVRNYIDFEWAILKDVGSNFFDRFHFCSRLCIVQFLIKREKKHGKRKQR